MTLPAVGSDERRSLRFALFMLAGVAIFGVVAIFYQAVLLSVLTSAFLTYLLRPLVERLARLGMPRTAAIVVMIFGSVAACVVAATQLAPVLYQQLLLLLQLLPRAVSVAVDTWLLSSEEFVASLGIVSQEDVHRFIAGLSFASRLEETLQAGFLNLWRTGTSLAGGALNVALVPLLTLFFLKDYQRLRLGFKRIVPRDLVLPLGDIMHRLDLTLRTVLKGQVIVAAILGLLYVTGLSLVGVKSAVAIGVVAGVCRLIPYLDVIVGGLLSGIVLVSDFHGWSEVLMVAGIFLVVQGIDGALVTPAVLGERIGLHPLIVILSVIAFGDWFGFWGVLLAVPIVAVVKVLVEAALAFYVRSSAYRAPWIDGRGPET